MLRTGFNTVFLLSASKSPHGDGGDNALELEPAYIVWYDAHTITINKVQFIFNLFKNLFYSLITVKV